MKNKTSLKRLKIIVLFIGIVLFTINACKKDNNSSEKKESKQVEENIIATIGGKLTTSDSINLVIPPNALPNNGKVFVGRTGSEPTSVPNTNLQIVGNPITIRIPSDSINSVIQLTFPAPSNSINTDNYCIFLYNGTTYFPVEYTLNGNTVTVSIDKINWESANNQKSLILSSIIIIALTNKETPPISEMGLKEFATGSQPFPTPKALNSSSKVLLLVHGLFSGPSKCWSSLIPKIQKETNPSYTNYWTFGYNSALSIDQNAQILANSLSTYYANGAQIDIVAHSMGGLVSRSMIEQYGGNKFISKLITLDTPHEGSPLAVFRYVVGAVVALDSGIGGYLIYNYESQGIRDLNTNSAYIQHMMTLQHPPLPYYTITATNASSMWNIVSNWLIPGLDDGVVSVVSATGVPGAVSPLPLSVVNIPVALAHIYVPGNDQIYDQLINYLKVSDNSIIFNPNLTYGTVTDIDGNVYKTIQIGTQTWMAENLKTTHYQNGDPIPNVTDDTNWWNLTSGAYCWNNNDAITYKSIYGALYNWYALTDSRNIAPTDWHVPSDSEWALLKTYLGGESVAGVKLTEIGSTHWHDPNSGTNESGFTALPGGNRAIYGVFNPVGDTGYWGSSTYSSSSDVWGQYIAEGLSNISLLGAKADGFSVRCVKNSSGTTITEEEVLNNNKKNINRNNTSLKGKK